MKFLTWLLTQTERNDPIGDLACDFRDDSMRPHHGYSIDKVERYLLCRGACKEAMAAFREAVKEYRRLRGES